MAAPADLSRCNRCGRPLPPSNSAEFGEWTVVKDADGGVCGMRCPRCQAAGEANDQNAHS